MLSSAEHGESCLWQICSQGRLFNISWASSPGYHTDWSPATAEDVEIIKSILPNGEWSWDPRPAVVTIDGRQIAVGIHLRPHAQNFALGNGLPSASNERPKDGWGPGGHMCMYYGDSPPNNSDWDKRMNEAARIAFNWGKGEWILWEEIFLNFSLCFMLLMFASVHSGCCNNLKPSSTSQPTGQLTPESATPEPMVKEHETPENPEEILEVKETILSAEEAEVI